ncbi:nucleoside hydrolase [Trichoderma gracile]
MAPKCKIILDTDPGVDDVMALLLALSASPEELELAMISVTYGNVPLQSCLRNVAAMYHVLEKEFEWRTSQGRPEGYETLKAHKTLIAAGAEHSLADPVLAADYFHGADGLHNVHDVHIDLSPAETWKALFDKDGGNDHDPSYPRFKASKQPAHKEMLRLLRENPPDTISILAVGPLTNVALAATEDPETFLRVKELVVMGGAVEVPGNVTPTAEFNTYADPLAAALVYALTSPTPASTLPPIPSHVSIKPYPAKLSRRLKVTLCPLDITNHHFINKNYFNETVKPLVDAGSPLARWTAHFINGAFDKIDSMEGDGREPELALHDPFTVWYMLTHDDPRWQTPAKPEDLRVETVGQWTRGSYVLDKRVRSKPGEAAGELSENLDNADHLVTLDEVPGDTMGWLSVRKGNRIGRLIKSPGEAIFKEVWMQRVFQ